jgi:DNA-binding GntR family transcriptional regulator
VSITDLPRFERGRKSGSKASYVCDELRAAIVALRIAPGAQIDKAAICEELGVSRQPCRGAGAPGGRTPCHGGAAEGTYVTRICMSDVAEAAFLREALESRNRPPLAPTSTLKRLAG